MLFRSPDDSGVAHHRCSESLGIYDASEEFYSVEHAIKSRYLLIQSGLTLFCATHKSFRCDMDFFKSSGFISDQPEALGRKVNFLIS